MKQKLEALKNVIELTEDKVGLATVVELIEEISLKGSTFLDRLQDEQSALKEKVEKLEDFIENNPAFKTVSEMQRVLLVTQLNAMKLYLYTLEERIYDLTREN